MPSLRDTALGSGAGGATSLSSTDALAVAEGDLIFVFGKFEGDGTPTMTCDTGAGTTQFATANPKFNAISNALTIQTFYLIATRSGAVNPRVVFSASVSFRSMFALSFPPDPGMTFVLSPNMDADEDASGTDATPLTGPVDSATVGVAINSLGLFGSRTISTPGSGWFTVPELNVSGTAHAQYRFPAGVESLSGDCTLSAAVEWASMIAIFNQRHTQVPFVGHFGRPRSRYGF